MEHDKPSKIVLVIDGFGHGGIQQTYKVLIREYCQVFNEVFLVIIQSTSDELKIDNFDNLMVTKFHGKKLFDIPTFFKFKKLISDIRPNIIISNMYRSHCWSSISRNKSAKLIWVEQNTYTARTFLQWRLLKILAKNVTKIVGISDEVSLLTGKKLNRKLVTIPNPITFTSIGAPPQSRTNDFIFVGRLTHQKNPELMLRSFHKFLTDYGRNSHLHIVGGGILLEPLKTLSVSLDIKDKCTFHGWKNLDEIYKIMSSVKTLVSTSSIEGMGIVRLEALVSGCCVVTTNTGGTHLFEQMNERGFFTCKDEIEDLSLAMKKSIHSRYWTQESIQERHSVIDLFNPWVISQELIK